jgi:elongation factor P--(R)-beta-lysine ligase
MKDLSPQHLTNLKQRADLLQRLRGFFHERAFIEVESPLLSAEVIPELHIEPPSLDTADGRRWLQASPELHMKRLVAAGMEALFQVTRSFRAGEQGRLHNPEFTIVEWYRVGDDLAGGMALLDNLCRSLLDTPPARRTSYAEAFQKYLGICPHTASCEELHQCASRQGVAIPEGLEQTNRDEWLNLLLATRIEPHLGADVPELLHAYPASQASLAKVTPHADGIRVAERFELYWQGVELANGYCELTDAAELRERLTEVNRQRAAEGRTVLPLPESLLSAQERGLPACAGCALGFDRLVMLALGAASIGEVMAFGEHGVE